MAFDRRERAWGNFFAILSGHRDDPAFSIDECLVSAMASLLSVRDKPVILRYPHNITNFHLLFSFLLKKKWGILASNTLAVLNALRGPGGEKTEWARQPLQRGPPPDAGCGWKAGSDAVWSGRRGRVRGLRGAGGAAMHSREVATARFALRSANGPG